MSLRRTIKRGFPEERAKQALKRDHKRYGHKARRDGCPLCPVSK